MPLVCPSEPSRCRPLLVGLGHSEEGPRLGGRAPAGIMPGAPAPGATYFLTMPLAGDREFSVFLLFDFRAMAAGSGALHSTGLLEIVSHSHSVRGSRSPLDSPLSEHPILLLDDKDDLCRLDDGELIVEPSSKLGGRPYFIHGEPDLEDPVTAAMNAGYLQLLQLDFPSGRGNALVKGDWPFADGLLHILGRHPFEHKDWLWFWEY